MAIYVFTEPAYEKNTWCGKTTQGILDESRYRKIDCRFRTAGSAPASGDLAALIGNSSAWLRNMFSEIRSRSQADLVIISSTPSDLPVYSICTDLKQSMREVLDYLRQDCGKERIALYGINPASTTDLLKLQGFSRTSDVYYSSGDLHRCFLDFSGRTGSYDAVICANDYAAISLLHNLKQLAPSEAQRLFLVGFSDLCISAKYSPSVTSVALDYYEYGRKAVDLYRLLQSSGQISGGVLHIRSRIVPRETTGCIPVRHAVRELPAEGAGNPVFFGDPEIDGLVLLENMFSGMDATDGRILDCLLRGVPYESAAQELHMSVNGIKYRVRKLLEAGGCEDRRALLELCRKYGLR